MYCKSDVCAFHRLLLKILSYTERTAIIITIMNSAAWCWSRDNSVGIARGYGLDGWSSKPVKGMIFLHSVQIGFGSNTVSYLMGTEAIFL
jgi:hypothetical protein